MLERIESCPLCTGNETEIEHQEQFYIPVSKEKWDIAEANLLSCKNCQFAFTDRLPQSQKYYQNLYSIRNNTDSLSSLTTDKRKEPIHKEASQLIRKYRSTGIFLDVGCGNGGMLEVMKDSFQVEGLEITEAAAKYTQSLGHRIYSKPFLNSKLLNEHYDVISFVDVLEHLPSPTANIKEASRILKPNGILFIKVPNYKMQLKKQLFFQKLGMSSVGIMYDFAHINHFTPESMKSFLETLNFEILEMKFTKPISIPFSKSLYSLQGLREFFLYRVGTFVANSLSRITGRSLGFNFCVLARKKSD